jgi:cilia- and flagella-associated protein 251
VFGQVRAQGEECSTSRAITGRLPLDHIPELMCALGYYPTQAEITDMISNMAYSAALQGEEKPVDTSLETFLYLYHNFKPVHGVRRELQSCLPPVLQSLHL